jgi:4-hydroxy-3-methylbut-2-enyl diphosphate reductase
MSVERGDRNRLWSTRSARLNLTEGGSGTLDSSPVSATQLAVVTALRSEQLALRRALPAGTPIARCGMGASRMLVVDAAEVDQALAVVVAGVAGSVDARYLPGDIVVPSEVRDGQGSIGLPAAALLVAELRAAGHVVHSGVLQSTVEIVHGAARRELAQSGVVAVDMESGPVLRRLLADDPDASRALAVVRVIVDTPDRPLLRPGTVSAGIRALSTLTRIGPALQRWSSAVGPRTVLLAAPRSFCAGVERAIDIVNLALDRASGPVYVRRQIVHNAHVVAELESRGAVFVTELSEVPDGAVVVLSAHGVAPAVRTEAMRRDMQVIDATCPLVAKVHAEARRFLARGDSVILIGHQGHDETEGTLGEAPDEITLVPDLATARVIEVARPDRLAYVTQTTLATDEVEQIAEVLRERFPGIAAPPSDDICYATTNRQNAVRAIAADADLVLVIGSQNSSNSRRLVEVAERVGARAQLIDDATGIRPGWLASARTVGITAGASAPPGLVDEVLATLGALGALEISERSVAREDITFALPKEVES